MRTYISSSSHFIHANNRNNVMALAKLMFATLTCSFSTPNTTQTSDNLIDKLGHWVSLGDDELRLQGPSSPEKFASKGKVSLKLWRENPCRNQIRMKLMLQRCSITSCYDVKICWELINHVEKCVLVFIYWWNGWWCWCNVVNLNRFFTHDRINIAEAYKSFLT